VWTRISCDAAVGLEQCITGRDIGMRGTASSAVLHSLRLAMFWPVKQGLEPHSLLTIGSGWHQRMMQLAALLDMGLQCYNVMDWKACLVHVFLLCVVLAWTEPKRHHCVWHGLCAALHSLLAMLAQ
jgi:hypothetical protein